MLKEVKDYANQTGPNGVKFGFYGAPLYKLDKEELIRLVKELDVELFKELVGVSKINHAIEEVISNYDGYMEED